MALTNEWRSYFKKIRENMDKSVSMAKADDTDILAIWGFIPMWSQKGIYAVGDPVRYDDYPYKCTIAHTASHYAGWQANLWKPYHGTTPETALPYTMPGGHGAYQIGEYAVWNGKTYKCIVANTVWNPSVLPEAWELIV